MLLNLVFKVMNKHLWIELFKICHKSHTYKTEQSERMWKVGMDPMS